MPGGSKTHYIRPNHQNRQPRRHIFLDTEARIDYDLHSHQQTQSWQCGVVRFLDNDPRRRAPAIRDADYLDVDSLWLDVSAFTRSNARTVLWAHNLAYDLRIGRALEILPALGWSLKAIVLDGLSCWAKFQNGDSSLLCADFASWASVPLARVAHMLGMAQEPFPDEPDDLDGLLRRCRMDVEILHRAVMSTITWVRDQELGNLQVTGAGQSWNAFRHRFMDEKILVHGIPKVREAERRAIWAGRTEALRHGTIKERTHEFDLVSAYATIARDCTLPTAYVGSLPQISLKNFREWSQSRHILSDCIVDTPVPVVPASHDDRILWPVGRFRTTLWDCEIHSALSRGARVRLYRSHVYASGRPLRRWAEWILESLAPEREEQLPDLQKRILKQWSRSLIGRFSLQYRSWEPLGTSDQPDLYLSKLAGGGERKGAQLMQVGHELLELGRLEESENSCPQITGYITAMCRVRLLELMETAGLENVYYTDTDSLIVNNDGRRRLDERIDTDGAYGLAYKGAISELDLNGPRQIVVDGERRYSGIPKKARANGNQEVVGEVWESLGEALRNGRGGKVIVKERTFNLTGQDKRRVWNPDGTTSPITLGMS